jgi:hypothetical protein
LPELGLCGVTVFADHVRGDPFSADRSQVRELGCVPGRLGFSVRRSLLSGLVGPVAVVVDQVFAEDQGQVLLVDDQDPVQEFRAERSDHSLANGVHPRGLRQRLSDLHPFGLEHLRERGGEDRVAVVDEEPQ